jgi:hypothetical protein
MIPLNLLNQDVMTIINYYVNNDPMILYNFIIMNDNYINNFFNINIDYVISWVEKSIENDLNDQILSLDDKIYNYENSINNEKYFIRLTNYYKYLTDPNYKNNKKIFIKNIKKFITE